MAEMLLADHQISLIYLLDDIDYSVADSLTLGDLLDGKYFPTKEARTLSNEHGDALIWEEATAALSQDLNTPLRDLLSGQRPSLMRRRTASVATSHLLKVGNVRNDKKGRFKAKDIRLELSTISRERLKTAGNDTEALCLQTASLERLDFTNGLTMIVATVEVSRPQSSDLSLMELQEAVHALSRFNQCRWYARSADEALMQERFSFGSFVHRLVRNNVPAQTYFSRVPSYVYAKLADKADSDTLEYTAACLARRYTADYPFNLQETSVGFVRDFDDLRHAVALEGMATVQCARHHEQETEFSANWKNAQLPKAYLPIYQSQLHQNWFLADRRAEAVSSNLDFEELDAHGARPSIHEQLERVAIDMMEFQLFYHFPSVSQITMHQAVASAAQDAMRLEEKRTHLQSTVQQVSDRLKAAHEEMEAKSAEERGQSFNFVARIGTASLAGLTAFTILRDVALLVMETFRIGPAPQTVDGAGGAMGAILRNFQGVPAQSIEAVLTRELLAGWIAFGVSFVLSLFTYWIVRRQAPMQSKWARGTSALLLNRISTHLRR